MKQLLETWTSLLDSFTYPATLILRPLNKRLGLRNEEVEETCPLPIRLPRHMEENEQQK